MINVSKGYHSINTVYTYTHACTQKAFIILVVIELSRDTREENKKKKKVFIFRTKLPQP